MVILDHLYSNTLLMTIVSIVVLFLCVGFAFLSPFKNKFFNWTYKVFLYLFAFSFMMAFNFFYFGFARDFEKIYIGGNSICLLEHYEIGGEGPDETVYRLHIIDKKTGAKKDRYYLGHKSELLGMQGDSICYLSNDDLVMFDTKEMKEVYKIKTNEWGTVLDELSVGLNSISGNQNQDGIIKPLVELSCKNAKNYWFDPFNKTILTKEPENIYISDFFAKPYEIIIKKSNTKFDYFLKTEAVNSSNLKKIVPADDKLNLFHPSEDVLFIEPFLIGIDTVRKNFMFGHYATTDQVDFFIECRDYNYKTIWKKTNKDLNASDSYNKDKVTVWALKNNTLYVNNGGFMLAIDPATGENIWTSRL